MVSEISIIDEDGANIDSGNDKKLVALRTPDNIIHYLEIGAAKEIIKSLEGQILLIEAGKKDWVKIG